MLKEIQKSSMRRADERKNDNVRIPVGFPKFQLAQGSFSREKIQQTMARFTEWFEGLNQMESYDDDLSRFEADGAALLPVTNDQGYVESDGARIWYATYGSGSPVILLHGGLGHGGNWGYQIPALVRSGYRAVLIDSRGHGRSTRDALPFMHEMMAFDVSAVMDALQLEKAALIGWRDHRVDPRHEGSRTRCRRVLLRLQDGSERRKANYGAQSDPRPVSGATREGLRPAIGYAGPIQGVRQGSQPYDENATQLFGPRFGSDQRASSDRP